MAALSLLSWACMVQRAGRVVETGTPAELLGRQPGFRALYAEAVGPEAEASRAA